MLMLAGLREIQIITTHDAIDDYKKLLGDGSQLGVNFEYATQDKPNGIAEAILISKEFVGDNKMVLVLGDNIFYGKGLDILMQEAIESSKEATVFGYRVKDPQRYGVIEFDDEGEVISIEEKPERPKSDKALVGLYFYPNEVIEIAKNINPSERGELEISSINQIFLEGGNLKAKILDKGFTWLDTGTHESLIEAGLFVHTLEKRQGTKIACLEEIAFEKNWISQETLISSAKSLSHTDYGQYLLNRYNT